MRKAPWVSVAAVCAAVSAVPLIAADRRGGAWLLHISDPHLFVDTTKPAPPADKNAAPRPKDEARITRQRDLNATALKDVLTRAWAFAPTDAEPRLVVLSGDLDFDPCWTTPNLPEPSAGEDRKAIVASCLKVDNAIDERQLQIKAAADALAASPARDIYVLPGNNDVARETADGAAIKYFIDFLALVQKRLTDENKSAVRLHALGGCYAGSADGDCTADVPDTPYRLVLLPSHSFKNADKAAFDMNDPLQQEQMKTFARLVDQARAAGKRAIVLSHIPNIDDPYFLGQERFARARGRAEVKVDGRSSTAAWNVSKPVVDAWMAAAGSSTVATVLSGHLHDPHRRTYREPYAWAPLDAYSQDRAKLLLTPPLTVTNQDASPFQARGVSLVHLLPDRVQRRLLWFDPDRHALTPDRPDDDRSDGRGRGRGWLHRWRERLLWVWNLAMPDSELNRLAILLIAFLAAFLTVARIWQIPAEDPLAPPPATPPAFEASPFAGPFGKTIMAGLGGLVVETAMKSLMADPPKNDKEYYVVWFVLFFMTMLGASAIVQGLVEATRVRLSMVRPIAFGATRGFAIPYWVRRFWQWVLSLRGPLLVFTDTVIQKLQGRNQTLSAFFAREIVNDHINRLQAIETVRRQLNDLFEHKLFEKRAVAGGIQPAVDSPSTSSVRVNISVMSADKSEVFYVATAPGSRAKRFIRRSVAWVAVFVGKIRWFKKSYRDGNPKFADIVLFDNQSNVIEGDEPLIKLTSHYQPRDEDYEAFVLFPVPWPGRSAGANDVRGAIHVSFRKEADFAQFWAIGRNDDGTPGPDPVLDANSPHYRFEDRVLEAWCLDGEVRAVLRNSLGVLSELIRGFNESVHVYQERIARR